MERRLVFTSAAGLMAALFGLSEIVMGFVKRSRGESATAKDRGSMVVLWIVILAAIAGAILCARWWPGRLPLSPVARDTTAIVLMASGLLLRWISIITLGRFFTVNVAAHADHKLVDFGPYRLVRHPSYTGLLIAFLGLGVFFGSWLGILILLVPITAALLYRIRVEEAALAGALGADYAAYRGRTKRLIPGLL
jgi:protein-S-isoprenylcysteine O-methyltransferase